MKYTIHGFSQKMAIEMNLKSDELLLLRWFVDFMGTNRMKKFFINDECFYWVRYDAILEDLPILDCKKRAVASKFKNLVDANVLKNQTLKQGGTYSVYAIGEKYESLVSDIGGCCLNDNGVTVETTTGCSSDDNGVAVSTAYKDLSIINPSTKSKKEKGDDISEKEKIEIIFQNYDLPPALLEKVKDWLEYKIEKKQGYKPKGLENFLTQVFNQYQKFGAEAVVSVISESMANNWQGIIWDKLKNTQANGGSFQSNSAQNSSKGKPANGFEKIIEEYGLGEDRHE